MIEKVDVGDVQLAVEDRGSGPVLLLVHGFPLDHTMWESQMEPLAHAFRVVAPDLRGFGQSGVTEGTVTMKQFADDLASLLAALDIQRRVALCGLSMGGYIAWQFWRHHAARLDCLILCDTRAAADTEQARQGRLTMAENVLRFGSPIVVEPMLPKLLAPATPQQRPEVVRLLSNMIVNSPPMGIAAAQRGMAERPDMTDLLGQIDVPTLVICGEHDTISPPEEMRSIAAAIPDSQFAVIPDAGHMSPMENPHAVNDTIRRFLAR